MATQTTIELVLVKLGGVFPSAKIGRDGIETYGEMLADIPDDVLIMAMKQCLMICRFFPTIAEIREKSEPFLEKLRIAQIVFPDEQLCYQNVERDASNTPICKLEKTCEFSATGKCKKWEH
jgi:hypothetical protein